MANYPFRARAQKAKLEADAFAMTRAEALWFRNPGPYGTVCVISATEELRGRRNLAAVFAWWH
jgi:hypothetical protein